MVPTKYPTRPAALASEQHDEWLLDDAIDDTFPASDPVSVGQPGSIVNVRYAALERRDRRPQVSGGPSGTTWWVLVGVAVTFAFLLVRRRRY
jgi:hypothetical protein